MSQSQESKPVVMGNHNLNLCSATERTGKCVKYYIRTDVSVTITQQEQAKGLPNAFEIMMASFRTATISSD